MPGQRRAVTNMLWYDCYGSICILCSSCADSDKVVTVFVTAIASDMQAPGSHVLNKATGLTCCHEEAAVQRTASGLLQLLQKEADLP